jgi:tetrahydromethanopterin S-methyltransferase subunit A
MEERRAAEGEKNRYGRRPYDNAMAEIRARLQQIENQMIENNNTMEKFSGHFALYMGLAGAAIACVGIFLGYLLRGLP